MDLREKLLETETSGIFWVIATKVVKNRQIQDKSRKLDEQASGTACT